MSPYLSVLEKIEKAGHKDSVQVIAVSKQRTLAEIEAVYAEGCRNFGENRIPEALEKISSLPNDIQWHFIGALQKNKVNKAIGKFALIHSVDTPELAEKIARSSEFANVTTSILLQVNTSGEASKQGLDPDSWRPHLDLLFSLKNIEIKGVMTMAPLTEDSSVIHKTFRRLREFRDELKLPLLSMGMSHDYEIALEEGANLLRIGTAIFS